MTKRFLVLSLCASVYLDLGLIHFSQAQTKKLPAKKTAPVSQDAKVTSPVATETKTQPKKSPDKAASPAAKKSAATKKPPSLSKGNVAVFHVKGNKKIEADAIIAKLKSKIGEPLDRERVREDVLAIYGMNYFYNVEVDQVVTAQGIELTYTVMEKPSVIEFVYNGNEEINDDDLATATGLKAYEILSQSRIQDAETKLLKAYEDKGYFLARVKHKIEEVQAGESVKVIFDVQENDKVRVKKVFFVGNRSIKDGEILNIMATKEDGFFSFLSSSGSYKQEAFDRDMQVIQYLYFNQGYVQVQVGKPEVTVTPDKKNIYISMRIEEGDQFSVGNVDFSGDLLYTRDELFEAIKIKDAGIFSYETLQLDLRELQAKYGDLGYAYANIIPRTQVREKEKLVDITFEIDKGNKVYFGEFNVVGNTKTRDKVLRREFEIREGELYNETRKRESIDKVKRLGYFEEVNFNSKTPIDKPDIQDLDVAVKERNTGSIQVGAGYSSFSAFVFNGQLQQTNLFGKGQKLGVTADLSKQTTVFKLSFTEPYFYDTKWSVGGDLYRSEIKRDIYTEIKQGAALRLGHPLAPYLEGYIRYKNDNTKINPGGDDVPDPTVPGTWMSTFDEVLYPVKTANGNTSSVTFTLEYDKRDDRFTPSNGFYSSASWEKAGLGGNLKYDKGYFNTRYYKKIFWDFVLRNNVTYATIISSNPEGPPFNELYLLGGANSLRGYYWFSVGKKKESEKQKKLGNDRWVPYGGTQQAYYNLELEFPLISEAGIKGVLFYDIGNADDVLMAGDFRSDYGFGFRWFSPIGPLRFEWGFPIDKRPGDAASNFEFAIGSPF